MEKKTRFLFRWRSSRLQAIDKTWVPKKKPSDFWSSWNLCMMFCSSCSALSMARLQNTASDRQIMSCFVDPQSSPWVSILKWLTGMMMMMMMMMMIKLYYFLLDFGVWSSHHEWDPIEYYWRMGFQPLPVDPGTTCHTRILRFMGQFMIPMG